MFSGLHLVCVGQIRTCRTALSVELRVAAPALNIAVWLPSGRVHRILLRTLSFSRLLCEAMRHGPCRWGDDGSDWLALSEPSQKMGHLSQELAATVEVATPLQVQLDRLGKRLGAIALTLGAGVDRARHCTRAHPWSGHRRRRLC